MYWSRLEITKETEEPNNCKSYHELYCYFSFYVMLYNTKPNLPTVIFGHQNHPVTDITRIRP